MSRSERLNIPYPGEGSTGASALVATRLRATMPLVEQQPGIRQKHTARNLTIVGLVVALVIAIVVAVGIAMSSVKPLGDLGTRPPVKPIPISATACPYLRSVSATASAANYSAGLAASDGKSWRAFAHRTAPALASFERSLQLAMPHVPRPVAAQLRVTLRQVVIGRPALMRSRSSADYLDRTNGAQLIGFSALADASSLVGNACGLTLVP